MENKFLTIDEIQQLAPQLEYHFKKLLFHKSEMSKVAVRIKRGGYSPQLIEEATSVGGEPFEIKRLQEWMREHYQSFKQHVIAVESMGGRIKDLELGRVEFNSFEENKVVLWVWQLGVTRTMHREDPFLEVITSPSSFDADHLSSYGFEKMRASI